MCSNNILIIFVMAVFLFSSVSLKAKSPEDTQQQNTYSKETNNQNIDNQSKNSRLTSDKPQSVNQELQEEYRLIINHQMQRENNARKNMNYVYEREQKHTIRPEKLSIESLQEGIDNAQTQVDEENSFKKISDTIYKSHLFLGLHFGLTFSAAQDNVHTLPTFNFKLGFQNFLGIASKQIGLQIYIDSMIASNILLSLKLDPFADFVDTTFSATNANAAVIFEVPLSSTLRYGVAGGFGIGYMTYHDKYWDRLNGFASNIALSSYIDIKKRHRVELGFRVFFYHYGSYITRKLDNIVQNPSTILSADFTKPMSLSLGWTYVF